MSPSERALRAYARLSDLLSQERGQTLGEYGLLISVVGVSAVVLGIIVFRNALITGYDAMTSCLLGSC